MVHNVMVDLEVPVRGDNIYIKKPDVYINKEELIKNNNKIKQEYIKNLAALYIEKNK